MILSPLRSFMVSIPLKRTHASNSNQILKFQFIIVVYIWTEAGNKHYSHIVIDTVKGTCEIMDSHADAQTDCIYFEVCKCMGSGVADIV